MYRAAQEAVTNVRRHARAGAVEIAITRTAASWRLRVADDGRGTSAGIDRGFGLTGIRSRVASAGGHVEIQTRAGGGFALTLDLPTTPVEIGARA
jgi:signal transduction histidine kinase